MSTINTMEKTAEQKNEEPLKNIDGSEAAGNLIKSESLADMSHRMRTPLNVIIGFSELMLEEIPGEINEKQKQYLNDILISSHKLLKLINDISCLSKSG